MSGKGGKGGKGGKIPSGEQKHGPQSRSARAGLQVPFFYHINPYPINSSQWEESIDS